MGQVDLTFNRAAKQLVKLEVVADWLRRHGVENVRAVVTGKAAALQISVPVLNMELPFDDTDIKDLEKCFSAISELIEMANVFGTASGISDLLNKS